MPERRDQRPCVKAYSVSGSGTLEGVKGNEDTDAPWSGVKHHNWFQ